MLIYWEKSQFVDNQQQRILKSGFIFRISAKSLVDISTDEKLNFSELFVNPTGSRCDSKRVTYDSKQVTYIPNGVT